MQSFRTELENPIVEQDIIDLERKIRAFREGKIHDEKFRSLRLARGVYGQRQPGVQMVRIKLPFGKVTFKQLLKIADISDEYGSSNLHLTTRQDIQIHYVSLDRTPQLWAELEQDDITLREACGNTVRNVTSSPTSGIDPLEPFDVSPYAQATFEYFLRNPICQEMGRKFKISFSSSDADTAFSYIHDIGAIPKVNEAGERGFKILLGGGLGAQPLLASPVEEFLPEDQLIPYIEAIIRVFDRHGERNNRNKARLKYLIQKIGLDEVLRLAKEERTALKVKSWPINRDAIPDPTLPVDITYSDAEITNPLRYEQWLATNVFEQKQKDFYGVYIKVPVGDIPTDVARKLVKAIKPYVADEIRITQNQGLLLKFVRKEALPALYAGLHALDLAAPGFDSLADVTTCPGTDTCNLGISNSMTMAKVLEDVIYNEYEDFIYNREIKIKISGCMNSCGQHGLAHIGFHGSSLKAGAKVLPSVQVMLGGGTVGNGVGRAAERVIKVPSKRATDVLRAVLDDYKINSISEETFHAYYDRQGKDYFYRMLKPLADLTTLTDDEFVDWGHQETYVSAIGVGECAGVIIDLVATLLFESEEKLGWANGAYAKGLWADAIYHSYNTMISSAKALLLDKGVNSSTQTGVIKEFDNNYVATGELALEGTFSDLVLQINKNEPSEEFATAYKQQATDFLEAGKIEERGSVAIMINNDTNNIKEARITLVGAGPGDAELITLKGIKALQTADVVLYDALVNDDLLEYAPADAVKVYVGKRSGDHSFSQDNINRLMVDYALNYGHVVRLKGGDPFVFGRGHEELDFAAEYNIPTQVVPGISSSIGVPGLQGIPVTHRGLSESFWVVTGTTSDGKVSADLYDAAKTNATIVVLMGIHKLAKIAEIFKNEGKGKLPVAVIQSGTTVNEKVVIGTADTITDLAAQQGITSPALIVLGEVVSLHPEFQLVKKVYDVVANG